MRRRCGVLALVLLHACGSSREDESISDAGVEQRDVQPLRGVVQLSAFNLHTCALLDSGQVACWGDTREGQLGTVADGPVSVPVLIEDLDDVEQVAAGGTSTCVLRRGGTVRCWGNQTPWLEATADPEPRTIDLPAAAEALSLGSQHACALNDGSVYCWGYNGQAQLGYQGEESSAAPRRLGDLADVTHIAPGWNHTCAVEAGGRVACWGTGDQTYQSGLFDDVYEGPWPPWIEGISDAVDVDVGFLSCAITEPGEVLCWDLVGERAMPDPNPPVRVALAEPATDLAVGFGHACAIVQGGAVYCWGSNDEAMVGARHRSRQEPAQKVEGIEGAIDVAAGYAHSCAATADAVYCWGSNEYGQLGDGTTVDRLVPVQVVDVGTEPRPFEWPTPTTDCPDPPIDEAALAATPRADTNLELLALAQSDDAVADEEVYERVVRDVSVIRDQDDALSGVGYFSPRDGKTVVLQVERETFDAMERGEYEAWNCLNWQLDVTDIAYNFLWVSELYWAFLELRGIYDTRRIAELYAALPGVMDVSSLDMPRPPHESTICLTREDDAWHYVFHVPGGDCATGCTTNDYRYFVTSASGVIDENAQWTDEGEADVEAPSWVSQYGTCEL